MLRELKLEKFDDVDVYELAQRVKLYSVPCVFDGAT